MENVNFRVAPYALFDTLWAFENDRNSEYHIEYGVSMEDGNLTVYAEKKYYPVPTQACTDARPR